MGKANTYLSVKDKKICEAPELTKTVAWLLAMHASISTNKVHFLILILHYHFSKQIVGLSIASSNNLIFWN